MLVLWKDYLLFAISDNGYLYYFGVRSLLFSVGDCMPEILTTIPWNGQSLILILHILITVL